MAGVHLFLTTAVLLLRRLKTSPLLIFLLSLHRSQASCNVTILLFYDETCDKCIKTDPSQLPYQDIFPRKSEVINFTWLKVNATSIKRSQVGVLSTLEFLEKHSTTVDGVIFIDVTPDSVAFTSLLNSLRILTVGLFQEQGGLRTEVTDISARLKCFTLPTYSLNGKTKRYILMLAKYFLARSPQGHVNFLLCGTINI